MASAQEGLNLSVKGIPQATLMMNTDNFDNDSHTTKINMGVAFGVGVGYNFTDNLGVSADLLYSLEGDKYEYELLGATSELINKYQYFKVPLQFVYNGDPSNTVAFRGKVGPSFNFLTGASVENWDGDELIDDTKDSYSSFVLGVALNAGVGINIADNLFLDAGFRADYGLTDAADEDSQPDGAASSNPFTGGIEVGLRYAL